MRCRYGLPFAAKESSARSETGGPRRRTQKRGNRRLSNHKFKIGQLVSYFCRERATTGLYTATQLLPPEGDDFQYRIRNASEPPKRVVKEHELEPGLVDARPKLERSDRHCSLGRAPPSTNRLRDGLKSRSEKFGFMTSGLRRAA
jgi:hypothetical protein